MQLRGKNVVNATPGIVWAMLMDTDTLARIVPGVSRLEKTGENVYKSTVEIKIGPVSGSFNGIVQMEEITDQKGFTLKVKQNSKIGNTDAAIKIGLLPIDTLQTEITFDGEVKMTGLLASMGQRVMSGVANTLTNQFFSNLEKELAKNKMATP
jgi:carbon monoxide dehydrogenase subunit G